MKTYLVQKQFKSSLFVMICLTLIHVSSALAQQDSKKLIIRWENSLVDSSWKAELPSLGAEDQASLNKLPEGMRGSAEALIYAQRNELKIDIGEAGSPLTFYIQEFEIQGSEFRFRIEGTRYELDGNGTMRSMDKNKGYDWNWKKLFP